MTNLFDPPGPDAQQALRRWLAAQGVEDTRGVEMLRLVRMVNSAYEAALTDSVADETLTPHRWRVLMRIWTEEQVGAGAVYPTQLSRAEQVSKNTMSEHLRALEDAGLIERQLDQEDRRQFRICLSPAGRELVSRCAPEHMRRMNALLDGLTPHEFDGLTRLLVRLKQVLAANMGQVPMACGPAHTAGSPQRDDQSLDSPPRL